MHPDFGADELKGLQALAASVGLVVHQLRPDNAPAAFLVARTTASREFAELDSAKRFIADWTGGRHAG